MMPHLSYSKKDSEKLKVFHIKPEKMADRAALMTVKWVSFLVNTLSRYNMGTMTEKKWLTRTLILETLSGVPAVVGGLARHMRILRLFKKDNGWIQ